ncbi:hypothetical protein HN51_010698, partial [Arachis hypogaea]
MSTPTDPGGWRSCAACRFCFSSSLGRRSPLLSIRFAIFLVHLATVPIAGTLIFWVGPFIGAALAAVYHQI